MCSDGKESAYNAGRPGFDPWVQEDPMEFAWRVAWTEEPDGLQSIGLQRVRHDYVTDFTSHMLYDTHDKQYIKCKVLLLQISNEG